MWLVTAANWLVSFVDRDMFMRYEWGMGIGHTYGWQNVRHDLHTEETSDSTLFTGIDESELNTCEAETSPGNISDMDDWEAEEDCSDFSDGTESEDEVSNSECEESDDEIYLEMDEMYH